MQTNKDTYWRQDGLSWFAGTQKKLPDSKKTWKVFYYTLLDDAGNLLNFFRREYIRYKFKGKKEPEREKFMNPTISFPNNAK